jgi:hypothetical protein
MSMGKQLKGDARLTYEPSGFVYALNIPFLGLAHFDSCRIAYVGTERRDLFDPFVDTGTDVLWQG